ncbi:MAG TPA: protein translocase subunit SecD [Anaerolineaceae bacterium]|nr:protein translocase subunit SecD [Anaerolineaceae bacterium]HPA32945.1 protein translocase subunit SecD [Anaerolineaceae bacterium]HQO97241.1 protein translocase subunit SecD [Anaerolineaceae bacterium]HQP60704.1 protein translocase subunit SecD [Anaerolineaceae bacterium]
MKRRTLNLILILIILAVAIWIDLPNNPGIKIGKIDKEIRTVLGLDLRGGMQVILQVDPNFTQPFTPEDLETAKSILERRSNGLGVAEVNFQISGDRYIVGELPGASKAEDVINVIKQTGQLEFVDTGDTELEAGTTITTDLGTDTTTPAEGETPAVGQLPGTETTVYHTIMTGDQLQDVAVVTNSLGEYEVNFVLKDDGAKIFADHTTNNTNKFLTIVLDKQVISSPIIRTPITEGQGSISGGFTRETANALAVQLRYGSLPIPLVVEQIRVVGPTLGQDSLDKSLIAYLIGFIIVALFMMIYYRLPGVAAVISIATYGIITFAIFRLIPVTLTLPGIAGLMLSTGSALDANILIFERMKEELRNGRTLMQAMELGWKRAWPSIRDSNIATLITSLILFWFGSTFGASIVQGFALTLFLGVLVSLFTAIIGTRTFLGLIISAVKEPEKRLGWFGL